MRLKQEKNGIFVGTLADFSPAYFERNKKRETQLGTIIAMNLAFSISCYYTSGNYEATSEDS